MPQDNTVSVVTKLLAEQLRKFCLISSWGEGICFQMSRLAVRFTHPPIQWVSEPLSL